MGSLQVRGPAARDPGGQTWTGRGAEGTHCSRCAPAVAQPGDPDGGSLGKAGSRGAPRHVHPTGIEMIHLDTSFLIRGLVRDSAEEDLQSLMKDVVARR